MSAFLKEFMTFAHSVTRADRSLVADDTLSIISSINVDDKARATATFQPLVERVLAEAHSSGQPVITNNVVTSPLEAPTTNISFNDLRIIVAVPLAAHGVVYLDRPVNQGVFTRDQLDRLMQFGVQLIADGHTHLTADEMQHQFSNH